MNMNEINKAEQENAKQELANARAKSAREEQSKKNLEAIQTQRASEVDSVNRAKAAKKEADIAALRQKSDDSIGKPSSSSSLPNRNTTSNVDFSSNSPSSSSKTSDSKNGNVDFSNSTTIRSGGNATPDTNFGTPTIPKYSDSTKFTELGISTVDTINSIGSFMSERILKGIKKSLSKMDKDLSGNENTFTPIAYPTLKLAEESGIAKIVSNDGTFNSIMEENENSSNDDGGVNKTKGNRSDISLGNADVINPPFQFNRNDDVRSNLSFPKLGRVFNEKINTNYPIAVFEVGTIKYSPGLLNGTFAETNDSDTALTDRIRGGGGVDLGAVLGFPFSMAAAVIKTSWKVLTYPAVAMLGLNKFARFSVDTALFARYFNDLSHHLAATMGLLTPLDIRSDVEVDLEDAKKADEEVNKLGEFVKKTLTREPTAQDMEGSYAGLRRRLLFESVVPGRGWGSAESDYIPFLVGKDISISESLSNGTQSNPLASALNSASAEAAALKANGNADGSGGNALEDARNKAKSTLNQVLSEQMRGAMSTVVSGEGRVSLPDMWTDSSFSRSVSMSFTFTSPYGHPLAIFENTYIPFLMLFCMSSPRQIGSRTFTNPFFVRVNMKGMFCIPLGIIESLTIERGDDKNNWTSESIPRTMKCSITIKDLSPTLMMGMTKNKFFNLFQGNDGLSSYLNVLGGLSLKEQRQLSSKVKRWWDLVAERGRGTGAKSVGGVLLNTINPFGYGESIVRGARSTFIGKTAVKLSQLNLNPFNNSDNPGRY